MKLSKIGITEFYGTNIDFKARFTLKERYEDFVVKEIMDSTVIEKGNLFDFRLIVDTYNWLKNNYNGNYTSEIDEFHNSINGFISENNFEEISNILKMYKLKLESNVLIVEIFEEEKEKRKKIHEKCREHPLLNTKTGLDNKISVNFGIRSKIIFRCVLTKTNKNTIEACNIVASRLKINAVSIKFAGNKDKRAVTHQEISIENSNFVDLFSLAYDLMKEDGSIFLSKIKQSVSSVKLGGLEGNQFEIRIRLSQKFLESQNLEQKGDSNNFKKYFEDLNLDRLNSGFINYFGQQRFGMNFSNHIIGKYILNKEYEWAIEEIMKETKHDNEEILKGRNLFFDCKYKDAIIFFPPKLSIEKYICKCKIDNKTDENTILSLKRETLKFYLHAYQSYIFNNEVSELIIKCKNENEIEKLNDLNLKLKVENNKHMKGSNRKIIEKCTNLKFSMEKDSILVNFSLKSSCYATMALREIIGDDVFYCE